MSTIYLAGNFAKRTRLGALRVGTLNIQYAKPTEASHETSLFEHLSITESGAESVEELAKLLQQQDLDVLALQEVDEGRMRSSGVKQAELLASRLGMTTLFAPTVHSYGLAILTRLPVKSWKILTLPSPRLPIHRDPNGLRGYKGWFVKWSEKRVCAYAVIQREGMPPLIVGNTHLDTINATARKQLQVAAGGFAKIQAQEGLDDAAWLLMGDFNLHPAEVEEVLGRREAASSALRVPPPGADGLEPVVVGKTYPNWRPTSQIDHMLGKGIVAEKQAVLHFPISDHAGMFATISPAE